MIRRKMTLLDAMILIAALAVAIAWARRLSAIFRENDAFDSTLLPPMPWRRWLTRWSVLAVPWMTMGSLGVLILRIKRPRPPLPELARQPGAVACFVALASGVLQMVLGIAASHVPGLAVLRPASDPDLAVLMFWLSNDTPEVGYSVMGAWVVLSAGHLGQAEPSTIDRTGRLLGVGWLAMLAAHHLGAYIRR